MNYKLAQQHVLEAAVRSLFASHHPPLTIHCNVRKSANMQHPLTGEPMELDVYLPELNLAFEYQDSHHYTSKWYANHPIHTYQLRDNIKMWTVASRGLTLIPIPFWWDQQIDSLKATIQLIRPDIQMGASSSLVASPVSPLPTADLFNDGCVPTVGELMIPMFATSINHVTKWWLSEKYDGLRALWNPVTNKLYSRQGRELFILHIIQQHFIPEFLDGEIWFGRDGFNTSAMISFKNLAHNIRWNSFRFIVFDNPANAQNEIKFENRVADIYGKLLDSSILIFASQMQSKDKPHIKLMLTYILDAKGEGVILRQPRTYYTHGKAPSLLKLKKQKDAEALVVNMEVINGEQSYICKLKNGTTFEATTADPKLQPKVGDVISFIYAFHLDKPKNPVIYRIRKDVLWTDPTALEHLKGLQQKVFADSPLKPRGHWSCNGSANVRLFFDQFASHRRLDPLLASTWYNVSYNDFVSAGGAGIREHYSGSFYQAILDIYPSIAATANSIVKEGNIKARSPRYLLYLCMCAENKVTEG